MVVFARTVLNDDTVVGLHPYCNICPRHAAGPEVGHYSVDLFSEQDALAIEVDGPTHFIEYVDERDGFQVKVRVIVADHTGCVDSCA